MHQVISLPERGRGPGPPERLVLERVSTQHHQRLLDVWRAHQREIDPFISRRDWPKIANFTSAPSQLLAIVATYQTGGRKTDVLAGHYAIDDRGQHIEFCFDRSFIAGFGLHHLSIDYRLYTVALSLVLGGRDRDVVPAYAAIRSGNERSRKNYRDLGAIEVNHLPACLQANKGAVPVLVPEVIFSVFTPDAMFAAYLRMLNRLRAGRAMMGNHEVRLEMIGGDLAVPAIAETLTAQVKQMCGLQARYSRKRYHIPKEVRY